MASKSPKTEKNQAQNGENSLEIGKKGRPRAGTKEYQSHRYHAKSPAEKLERIWRQQARPPFPQPGSTRSTITRNIALALAYRPWSDLERVVRLYRVCAVLNELGWGRFCVDHIVPVGSPRVCGLHTHDNLQIVTEQENREKGHWWWPQMWPIEEERDEALFDQARKTLHFTMRNTPRSFHNVKCRD